MFKYLGVKKARDGDKEAFTKLIDENIDSMYRVAKGILSQSEDIEDAIQNTIVAAFQGINNLREVKYFKTCLIRILREKNLGPLELGGGSASSQGRNKMAGYMRITLDSLEEMKNLSELEIIPVVNNMQNSENNKEENLDKYNDITINTDRPTIIKSDDNGELEVSSIEFKDNEALISIKATGDKVYERPAFYDSEDKWYANNRIINRSFVDGTFTYTMVMDKMDKEKEYFYRDYHRWQGGTILEDEKITVKVK